jgi:hypothetical protein
VDLAVAGTWIEVEGVPTVWRLCLRSRAARSLTLLLR